MKRNLWRTAVIIFAVLLTGCTRYIGTPPGPAIPIERTATGSAATTPIPTGIPATATAPSAHLPPEGSRATVSEVVNIIDMRLSADVPFELASEGSILGVGSQVRTGADSRARLNLAENAIVRVGANTLISLETISSEGDVPVSLIRLEEGHLWLGVTAGTLQVLTPMGIVSLNGNYAILQFSPTDNTLTIECFDGPCVVQTIAGEQQAGRLERLTLSDNGDKAERDELDDDDVQSFIAFNPEASAPLFEALLESSPPTRTATNAPTEETTQPATETETPTEAATSTPTVAPTTGVVPGSALGIHVVRANESMYCIGRAYGVVPDAIAKANGIAVTATILVGRELIIPAVQWGSMGNGPVCVAQFQSPYVTATVTP